MYQPYKVIYPLQNNIYNKKQNILLSNDVLDLRVLAKSDELIEAIVDKKTTFSKTVKQLNEKI